jgi:DNA-binding NarL/FixJ family response regulator
LLKITATIREGLEILINGTERLPIVHPSYDQCESMLEEIESLNADVILMDIDLPGMNGIEGIKQS